MTDLTTADTRTDTTPATAEAGNFVVADDGESEVDLNELLDLAIEKEASDVHFGAESKIALRIYGEIRFIESAGELGKAQAEKLIFGLLKGEEERNKLIQNRELDFSYKYVDGTTFRCNAFYRRGRIAIVMRRIAKSVPALDALGLPPAIHQFTQAKQGLFLVCGPTGSGKSTTLASMLEEVNETRVEHVVTIEDPIEYIFAEKKCTFSQRELHYDTLSFESALRAVMRQDPDVVMIGEMRDRETITASLNLCETGHLVFSTLHTSGSTQTISRLSQAFPLDQQGAILSRVADSLLGVLSQRLIPKIGGGRVAVFELMVVNDAIRNAIRKGDLPQINNSIATSTGLGMVSMKKSAEKLISQGIIEAESVAPFFRTE